MKSIVVFLMSLGLVSGIAYADNASSTSPSQGTEMTSPEAADAAANKSVGEKFMTDNKRKGGIQTLPDGLQYKVIKQGHGVSPDGNDVVTVNYAGRFINGKEFDSSYKRGEPTTFPVNAVIAGWAEALKLMKPGSVWEVYVPSDLAYGEQGMPPTIGPNQTLIFKIELLNVKKQ